MTDIELRYDAADEASYDWLYFAIAMSINGLAWCGIGLVIGWMVWA